MPELQQCSTLVLTAPAVLKAVFLQRFYLRGWLEEHVMAAVCAQQGGTSPVVPHLYDDTTTVEHRCLRALKQINQDWWELLIVNILQQFAFLVWQTNGLCLCPSSRLEHQGISFIARVQV